MINVRLLKATSSDAAGLLAQAIQTNDEALAHSAIELFQDAVGMAMAEQQYNFLPAIVHDQVKVYDFKKLVEYHRTGKLSEPLFRLVIETFRPSYWDIYAIEKSRISIDKIMVDSYLQGDDPDYKNCIRLLQDLSCRASHLAMVSVLLQAFERLKDAEEIDLAHPTLFEVINNYNKDFKATKPLAAHLITFIHEHEDVFLGLINRDYLNRPKSTSLVFCMPILSQLHAAGNRTLVARMAAEHARLDVEDPWVVVKAKALGADIPLAGVAAVIESYFDKPTYTSHMVYALNSDEAPADFIKVPPSTKASKLTPMLEAIGIVFDAIPEGEKPGLLLLEKTEHVVTQLFELPYKAELIMDQLIQMAHLPKELLLSFAAAREQMLCLDLGI